MNIETLNADYQCLPPGDSVRLMAQQPVFVARRLRTELFSHVREIGAEVECLADARAVDSLSGIYNSFDFHLTADGPRLIEINTNAGGAFLQPAIAAAFRGALPWPESAGTAPPFRPERVILDAWQALRPGAPLPRVAIVDRDPVNEPLWPDMAAAASALQAAGAHAEVIRLDQLRLLHDGLAGPGGRIDFVYNRSTDFLFETADTQVLRAAWQANLALVAPNPAVYQVYADKNRLLQLAEAKVASPLRLAAVLPALRVTAGNAASLWQSRRNWYFKPLNGYGSRGVLRGDGISRSRFEALLGGGYLAQAAAAPLTRTVMGPAGAVRYKYDVRIWTHGTRPVFAVARLFRGQVTSMRHPGEGFAPIAWVAEPPAASRGEPR
jgi:hypothetical protein